MRMTFPTEPIGSIPRPLALIEAVATTDGTDLALAPMYEEAIRDTIEHLPTYQGAFTSYSFSPEQHVGIVKNPYTSGRVENAKLVPIK